MTDVEKPCSTCVGHLEWLLDYARRVAQRQVVQADWERLREVRQFIKKFNEGREAK